jgi:hypothetical protein
VANFGDVVRERRWRMSDYLRTTRACKLFDFDEGRWYTYEEAAEHLAQARARAAA